MALDVTPGLLVQSSRLAAVAWIQASFSKPCLPSSPTDIDCLIALRADSSLFTVRCVAVDLIQVVVAITDVFANDLFFIATDACVAKHVVQTRNTPLKLVTIAVIALSLIHI